MKSSVRRVKTAITPPSASGTALQTAETVVAPVTRHADGLSVTSEKSLGADPSVLLTWNVEHQLWQDGFRLLGFRSATSFAPEKYSRDFSAHGQMILEETADGQLEEHLPEGTHFYTFVLYKKHFLRLMESIAVVRFSEMIPTARTAIGRIEDQLKLQQLGEAHELQGIKKQIARNEAIIALHRSDQKLRALQEVKTDESIDEQVRRDVESIVRKKLKKAMTRVEMLTALQDNQKRLKRNPAWKKLNELEREQILKDIMEDLDADEEQMQP
jgi:hypothetical protein